MLAKLILIDILVFFMTYKSILSLLYILSPKLIKELEEWWSKANEE